MCNAPHTTNYLIAYCGDWLVLDEPELTLFVLLLTPVLELPEMLLLDAPDWLLAELPELFGWLLVPRFTEFVSVLPEP